MSTFDVTTRWPDDAFRGAVESAVRGQADPHQIAALDADPERHLLVLAELKRDVEAQFALKEADLAENRARCFRMGPDGREVFASYEAEHRAWKAGAVRFKVSVENAVGRVKAGMRRDDIAGHEVRFAGRIAELERRIEVLEAGR